MKYVFGMIVLASSLLSMNSYAEDDADKRRLVEKLAAIGHWTDGAKEIKEMAIKDIMAASDENGEWNLYYKKLEEQLDVEVIVNRWKEVAIERYSVDELKAKIAFDESLYGRSYMEKVRLHSAEDNETIRKWLKDAQQNAFKSTLNGTIPKELTPSAIGSN